MTSSVLESHLLAVVLRFRYLFFLAVVASMAIVESSHRRGDWPSFAVAARGFIDGGQGFAVYSHHQDLITGPAGLVTVRALLLVGGYTAALIVFGLLGIALVWMIERLGSAPELAVFLGGALFLLAWMDMIAYGHVDDALVCCAVVATVWACKRHHPELAGVFLALAIVSKQWAIILTPLVLAFKGRDRVRAAAIAAMAASVVWLPFVLTTSSITSTSAFVAPDSLPALLGVQVAGVLVQSWWRPVELVVALAAGVWVGVRRWEAVPVVVLGVRVALDPSTWSYYAAPVVLGALIVDLIVARRRFPWWTIAAYACVFKVDSWADHHVAATVRLLFVASALIWVTMYEATRATSDELL